MRDVKGLIWEETNLIAHCLPRGHEFNEWFTVALDGSEYQLMQSTGLKDKNGVEIFEGDVVVHEEGEYSYKGVVLKDKYYFYIEGVNINDSFSFDDISNTLIGEADLEVIGNIYENPELLEQANEN